MNVLLVAAAALVVFLGIAHSYLGERYILGRLFRRGNLAEIFRKPEFTRRTLRLAWHIMSVLAFGFAALLVALASAERVELRTLCRIMAVTFALCGVLSLGISRSRHLSWIVFFAIAGLVWIAQG
jgi:hypothetical protein